LVSPAGKWNSRHLGWCRDPFSKGCCTPLLNYRHLPFSLSSLPLFYPARSGQPLFGLYPYGRTGSATRRVWQFLSFSPPLLYPTRSGQPLNGRYPSGVTDSVTHRVWQYIFYPPPRCPSRQLQYLRTRLLVLLMRRTLAIKVELTILLLFSFAVSRHWGCRWPTRDG
jgi:hypothetical protein